jgi:hypothetical protein
MAAYAELHLSDDELSLLDDLYESYLNGSLIVKNDDKIVYTNPK